jgi:copper transport protein
VTHRAVAVSIGIVALVGLLAWGGASAHAVLLRATPSANQTLGQAPDQVQLLFSEPLDPIFSSVRVVNAAGQPVDRGDSRVDAANDHVLAVSLTTGLPNGVYTVNWRSLSAIDVHPDEGQYQLFIGVPVSTSAVRASTAQTFTATPETTIGRLWFYVAASLFGGVLAAWKLVLGGVLVDSVRETVRRRVYQLIVFGGLLLIVGTLFTAIAQAAAAADVPLANALGKPLSDLLLRGRFASIWWPRIGLELASLFLIAFGGVGGLASECALATLPAVLLTSALTSHGAALAAGAGLGIAIDWLHIVGATAWVGGLIALLTCIAAVRSSTQTSGLVARLVGRFSRFALIASATVLLSGVVQGALELGTWSALATTLYGQLVLVKIGLLLAMLLLAGYNEWQTRQPHTAAVGLRRGVRIEFGLGVLVFAAAALLSGTPPSPIA